MDKICRLCLKVVDKMAYKVCEDPGIKLCCLKIQPHDFLPSNICYSCFNTLLDFQSFRETIIQNETKLKQLLSEKNNMNEIYESLNNGNVVKVEILKAENGGENNDIFNDEPFKNENCENGEKLDIENEMETPKKVEEITFKMENLTKENNIPNTDIPKSRKGTRRKPKALTNTKKKLLITKQNTGSSKSRTDINIDIGYQIAEIKINDHKCLTCFKNLSSQSELINHYKTEHNIYNNKNIKNSNKLENTKINIEKKEEGNKSSCKKEKKVIENSEKLYNCGYCGRTFNNVYTIVRHGRTHSDANFVCSRGCGYATVYSGALRIHEKRHDKDFTYKCETCGAGFYLKSYHDEHQNVHKKIKPFVCDVCGMAFHMSRYLKTHRARHPDSVNNRGAQYICSRCDLVFYNKHTFNLHMEEHNGKRKFLCDLCGKVCSTNEQLKYHNKTHLGLRPFSCTLCDKKFSKKYNLTMHVKAHAGEKHLCQTCGKHFAQRSTLLRHARLHCRRDKVVDKAEDENSIESKKMFNFTSN